MLYIDFETGCHIGNGEKLSSSQAEPGQTSCCLVALHFLCDILSGHPVFPATIFHISFRSKLICIFAKIRLALASQREMTTKDLTEAEISISTPTLGSDFDNLQLCLPATDRILETRIVEALPSSSSSSSSKQSLPYPHIHNTYYCQCTLPPSMTTS